MKTTQNMKTKYRDTLSNKNFIYELIGSVFSRFGDGIDTIAFSLIVYRITGSTLLLASVFAINGLPNIIFSFFSGVLSTKMNEVHVVRICDATRAILTLLIALLYAQGNLQLWHLYLVTFLNSTVETFRGPAAGSVLGYIIDDETIDTAVSLKTGLEKVAEVIGLAVAPAICSGLGLHMALIIDAITFVICAISVSNIKFEKTESFEEEKFTDLFLGGVSYLSSNKTLIKILLFSVIANIVIVPLNIFQVPLIEDELLLSDYYISAIGISISISMIIGSIIVPFLKNYMSDIVLFRLSGVTITLAYVILWAIQFANMPVRVVGLIASMLLVGLGISAANIILQAIFYKIVDESYFSRMGAISSMAAYCANPIFSAVFGLASSFVSILTIFLSCAVLCLLVFSCTRDFTAVNAR